MYPKCTIGKVTQEQLNGMSDQSLLEKPIVAFASNLFELVVTQTLSEGATQFIAQLAGTKDEVFHQLVKVLTTCIHASLVGMLDHFIV